MNDNIYYLAVVGGGASGLVATAVCSNELLKLNYKDKVVLLEKESKVGKKVLATGNGKCNLTNVNALASNYYGDIEFVESALEKYSPYDIIQYFNNLGIMIKENTQGRMYPYTNQSTTICNALINDIEKENIDIICDCNVVDIDYYKGVFTITTNNSVVKAKKILFATGGKSNKPNNIYNIIEKLGHKVTSLFPGLCPILVKSKYIKSLKGIRHSGKVTLMADNKPIKSEIGEIQFNENNLSGICIFNISRLVNEFITYKSIDNIPYKSITISLDLYADYSFKDLYDFIYDFQKKSNIIGFEIIEGLLHKNLAKAVYDYAFKEKKMDRLLTNQEIKSLVSAIKNFNFNISGEYTWKNNQITCGGVSIQSVNPVNFQSRYNKNIYFCGEVLNVDGDCGGYNLQFAFSSGIIVGKEIVK